ncbi:MAG TPA: hypothetical protein VLB82_05260 [Thermodesulfobacteriota bacterium]|jgi:ATP-dependent Lon protease|nr:hypothetical protein [Thermodesulfobacteriota bacterium]
MSEKVINRIEKKIDQIEKMHDKESILCEEVKDLLAELRENQESNQDWEDDIDDENFDEDEIDEDEE